MIIAGVYSFKGGKEVIEGHSTLELAEVMQVIQAVTMSGKTLYSPAALNEACRMTFQSFGWQGRRIACEYTADFYTPGYTPSTTTHGAFREIDFVKNKLGVEVQFGKYAFMVYNVCAKMTIFHNMGIIDAGVEIVPVRDFAAEMSTGVSYFEQIVWDLENRGVADIDIPVLVLGVAV